MMMDHYSNVSSSPDPLNDDSIYTSPMKLKATQSHRRGSVSIRSGSPRKQTFELELGDRVSPRRIRVTVEAEGDTLDKGNSRARIYKSIEAEETPTRKRASVNTSKRRGGTTTTIVPLKGLTDDEADDGVTPKRKSARSRKTNGTPIVRAKKSILTPSTGNKRSESVINDVASSAKENLLDITPLPRRRGRPRKTAVVEIPVVANTQVQDDIEPVGFVSDVASPILQANDDARSMSRPVTATYRASVDRTSGQNQDDVLLAQFEKGQTPNYTGWSSPKISSSRRMSNSDTRITSDIALESDRGGSRTDDTVTDRPQHNETLEHNDQTSIEKC